MWSRIIRNRLEVPDESRERTLRIGQFARALGVVDHCFNLAAMTDDAGISQKTRHIGPVKNRNLAKIEPSKSGAEIFALGQDRAPTQPRLKTLEAELFEEADVVTYGKTPLMIMIIKEFGGSSAPSTTWAPIGAGHGLSHVYSFRKSSAETVRFSSIS